MTKEEKRDYMKLYFRRNPERTRFHRRMSEARKVGIPVSITFEEIHWPAVCPVLGIPLDYGTDKGGMPRPNSPSIDRFKPELGYVAGNVHVISLRANTLKNNATTDELRSVLRWMEGKT